MKRIATYAAALMLACGIAGGAYAQNAPHPASQHEVLDAYNAAAKRGDAIFENAMKSAETSFKADEQKAAAARDAAKKLVLEGLDIKMKKAELDHAVGVNLAEQAKDANAIKIRRDFDDQAQDAQRVFDAALEKATSDKNAAIAMTGNAQAAEATYAAAVKQAREDFVAKEVALMDSRDKALDQAETVKQASIDAVQEAYIAVQKQVTDETLLSSKPAEDTYELAIIPGVYSGFDALKKARVESDILRQKRLVMWNAYTKGLISADDAIVELNKIGK